MDQHSAGLVHSSPGRVFGMMLTCDVKTIRLLFLMLTTPSQMPCKIQKNTHCCIYDLVKSGLDGIDIFRRNAKILNMFSIIVFATCKK